MFIWSLLGTVPTPNVIAPGSPLTFARMSFALLWGESASTAQTRYSVTRRAIGVTSVYVSVVVPTMRFV